MQNWIEQYVHSLSPAEFHVQILLLSAALLWLVYLSWKTWRRYLFIQDTATSKIASAAQGYTEIKGIGEWIPGGEVISPFSQRRCLWYQCRIEQRKSFGKSTRWIEYSHETSDHIFYLKDDTGQCIILPEQAHIIPSVEYRWYGGSLHDRYRRPLTSGWLSLLLGFGSYRFTERLILVADPLYAIGFFKSIRKNAVTDGVNQQVNDLVEQWKKNPRKYLSTFDSDKNGKIQGDEWKQVRKHARSIVLQNRQQMVHHSLQKPLLDNQPFVISALPEERLLKRKFYQLCGYSVLFLLLFSLLIIILKT